MLAVVVVVVGVGSRFMTATGATEMAGAAAVGAVDSAAASSGAASSPLSVAAGPNAAV